MIFGGTLGEMDTAYLTWTNGTDAYATVIDKGELEGLPNSSS